MTNSVSRPVHYFSQYKPATTNQFYSVCLKYSWYYPAHAGCNLLDSDCQLNTNVASEVWRTSGLTVVQSECKTGIFYSRVARCFERCPRLCLQIGKIWREQRECILVLFFSNLEDIYVLFLLEICFKCINTWCFVYWSNNFTKIN